MPTLRDLLDGHCHEYPKGLSTLNHSEVAERIPLVPNWELVDGGKGLRFSRRLADFMAAVDLVNQVAVIAEDEQHHPDIRIHGYRNLVLDLSTHSIGGLTDNDFIMAAKINRLLDA
ncbi:MAG TPA: 4a-hydroxytetrahydrobiopterin dehydratase [Dehalococcoidia bacterium]|nr:4a-hydroxytetrahydrobiopterin dehydratase [Dehalococcoidia bacterium]